jgi:hypothetical protein
MEDEVAALKKKLGSEQPKSSNLNLSTFSSQPVKIDLKNIQPKPIGVKASFNLNESIITSGGDEHAIKKYGSLNSARE